jgi:hypothetical protein
MRFTQHISGLVKAIALVLALALPIVLAASAADARVSGGFSSGSRGSRSFSTPPPTATAPNSASPFDRSYSRPGNPGMASPLGGGFFNRPGGSLLGGLAAGFLGAGLFGMLFGGGLFSGIGGFSSVLGLILQIVLIVFLVVVAPPPVVAAGLCRRRPPWRWSAIELTQRHGIWLGIGQCAAQDRAGRLRGVRAALG